VSFSSHKGDEGQEDWETECRGKEEITRRGMKCLHGFDWTNDWPTWRGNAKERIALAHTSGVPCETVTAIASKAGDLLAKKACPPTQEEKQLKKMWTVATLDERKRISASILRMVQ